MFCLLTQVQILIHDLRGGEWDTWRCAADSLIEASEIKAKPCNACDTGLTSRAEKRNSKNVRLIKKAMFSVKY